PGKANNSGKVRTLPQLPAGSPTSPRTPIFCHWKCTTRSPSNLKVCPSERATSRHRRGPESLAALAPVRLALVVGTGPRPAPVQPAPGPGRGSPGRFTHVLWPVSARPFWPKQPGQHRAFFVVHPVSALALVDLSRLRSPAPDRPGTRNLDRVGPHAGLLPEPVSSHLDHLAHLRHTVSIRFMEP